MLLQSLQVHATLTNVQKVGGESECAEIHGDEVVLSDGTTTGTIMYESLLGQVVGEQRTDAESSDEIAHGHAPYVEGCRSTTTTVVHDEDDVLEHRQHCHDPHDNAERVLPEDVHCDRLLMLLVLLCRVVVEQAVVCCVGVDQVQRLLYCCVHFCCYCYNCCCCYKVGILHPDGQLYEGDAALS